MKTVNQTMWKDEKRTCAEWSELTSERGGARCGRALSYSGRVMAGNEAEEEARGQIRNVKSSKGKWDVSDSRKKEEEESA